MLNYTGNQTQSAARWPAIVISLALVFTVLIVASIGSARAQSVNGGVLITHPMAGSVLGNNDVIYFSPGDIDIYEWRITLGTSPEVSGLFDSGVRVFSESPWELPVNGIPATGKPVTMRFWQRLKGKRWTTTDIVYNTRIGTAGEESQAAPATGADVAETSSVAAAANVAANNRQIALELTAAHRNGQTYITWTEVAGDVGYHVYRHTSPITQENLQQAEQLTAQWGPLDGNTSVNKHAHGLVPTTYVIEDSGQPLSESQGLFVHTAAQDANSYFAVTTVVQGTETATIEAGKNSLRNPVAESVSPAKPVLTVSLNRGKGRVYTQYMDYANWNPTFNGYAYNYTVTLPVGYKKSYSYPLLLRPHAYGEDFSVQDETEYGWQVIQIFPSDPGETRGSVPSWWFGYAADHNYLTDGQVPTSGSVANFTEQRVMKAIQDTINDPGINVDTQLVHAFGHSMGGSGSLSLGIRYGNVFAGIYGSEAMTNYKTSPKFQFDMERLWGSQSTNLPIVINGPYTAPIKQYDGTGVWDWMNHHQQLIKRRGDNMAFLMLALGKADDIIDWQTQGVPMARVFNQASVGYSANYIANAGHSWLGFSAIVHTLFGFGNDVDFPWRYPNNLSFPAVANASGSGSMTPGLEENDAYNMDIEWATPHTRFAKSIVDKPRQYEVSLRSKSDAQTADITPRNTQNFSVRPAEQCSWIAIDSNKRRQVGKGSVIVDDDGLLTIPQVLITPYKGTRVAIDCR